MTRTMLILFVLFAFCIPAVFAGSEPNMQEGMWEVTSRVEMPGMPVAMPPAVHTQCLTKKDFVPRGDRNSQGCTISDTVMSGDTASWEMVCNTPGGTTKGSGSIKYMGDRFEGSVTMTVPGISDMDQYFERVAW